MLIDVSKKHEKFLCTCLQECSKRDIAEKAPMVFVALVGDEYLIMEDNCDHNEMSMIAMHLNKQAIMDAVFETTEMMGLYFKKNMNEDEDTESESED